MLRYLLPSLALGSTGCVSFTTAQDARTMDKGKTSSYLGLALHSEDSEEKDEDGTKTEQSVMGFVGGARHGLAEGLDVGARGSTLGLVMIDGKFEIVSTRAFAMAIGLGLGFVDYEYESKSANARSESEGHTRITDVPLYLSYDVLLGVTVYGVPRYVYAHSESDNGDDEGGDGGGSGRLVGMTAGLLVGGKLGWFVEGAFFKSPDKDTDSDGTQLAFGLTFGR